MSMWKRQEDWKVGPTPSHFAPDEGFHNVKRCPRMAATTTITMNSTPNCNQDWACLSHVDDDLSPPALDLETETPGEGGSVPDAEVRFFDAVGQDAAVGLQAALLREGGGTPSIPHSHSHAHACGVTGDGGSMCGRRDAVL